MQSEKLLRKVQEVLMTSPSNVPEWHADRVWQKVQQRQKKKTQWFMFRRLAAAVVVIGLVGLLFAVYSSHFLIDQQTLGNSGKTHGQYQVADSNLIMSQKADSVSSDKQPAVGASSLTINSKIKPQKTQQHRRIHIADNDPTATSESTVQELNNLSKTDVSTLDEPPEIRFSIAHLKSENLSPLLNMYRQAEQERENRKMNITLAGIHRPHSALVSC